MVFFSRIKYNQTKTKYKQVEKWCFIHFEIAANRHHFIENDNKQETHNGKNWDEEAADGKQKERQSSTHGTWTKNIHGLFKGNGDLRYQMFLMKIAFLGELTAERHRGGGVTICGGRENEWRLMFVIYFGDFWNFLLCFIRSKIFKFTLLGLLKLKDALKGLAQRFGGVCGNFRNFDRAKSVVSEINKTSKSLKVGKQKKESKSLKFTLKNIYTCYTSLFLFFSKKKKLKNREMIISYYKSKFWKIEVLKVYLNLLDICPKDPNIIFKF